MVSALVNPQGFSRHLGRKERGGYPACGSAEKQPALYFEVCLCVCIYICI